MLHSVPKPFHCASNTLRSGREAIRTRREAGRRGREAGHTGRGAFPGVRTPAPTFAGHCWKGPIPDASTMALVQLHWSALAPNWLAPSVHEPRGAPPTSSLPPQASIAARATAIQVRMRR